MIKKIKNINRGSFILPSFVKEIYHERTEDEENEQSDKHVIDSPDVVHLEQLTAEIQMT